jgi:hypothetical protein
MSTNVMHDLETMSALPDALICSIGACKFDPEGPIDQKITDTFYCTIDSKDAMSYDKFSIQEETLAWWQKQNPEAFKALRKNTIPLKEALEKYAAWFGKKSMPTWGNGSDFDNVITDHAFRVVGIKTPYTPWDRRCFRTLKSIFGVKPPSREGTYHNALDDAIYQAKYALAIFNS